MPPGVSLREVQNTDLPILYAHQLDTDAIRMADFPARAHDEFMAHWAKIMGDKTNLLRTIVVDGMVVGHLGSWQQAGVAHLGYWLGKEYWGHGIATSAASQFLREMTQRPVYAHVAKRNLGSIRVLEKCGFGMVGEERFPSVTGEIAEGLIMMLPDVPDSHANTGEGQSQSP